MRLAWRSTAPIAATTGRGLLLTGRRRATRRDGVWRSAEDALAILDGLLALVTAQKPRFGLVRNDYDAVVAELSESIAFAKKAGAAAARFNPSVVT